MSESIKFDYLLKKKVLKIFRPVIIEENIEYDLDYTLIIELNNNEYIQILSDYDVLLYKLSNINEIKVLGDFKIDGIDLIELAYLDSGEINIIKNHIESPYEKLYISSVFFSSNKDFVFGFFYAQDEANFSSDINKLNMLLDRYRNQNIEYKTLIIV